MKKYKLQTLLSKDGVAYLQKRITWAMGWCWEMFLMNIAGDLNNKEIYWG